MPFGIPPVISIVHQSITLFHFLSDSLSPRGSIVNFVDIFIASLYLDVSRAALVTDGSVKPMRSIGLVAAVFAS